MITNSSLTLYHRGYDNENRKSIWTRYNFDNVWWFGGKGAGINKGYDNANNVEVRIPYQINMNLSNIAIGDIIVQGTLTTDIDTQQDLSSYDIYNITSINNNNFGNNPHIHLGGK